MAEHEMKISEFLSSDTPIAKLLNEEIPAVIQTKKDLERLVTRHQQGVNNLEKEDKKLEKMQNAINSKDPDRQDSVVDQEILNQQIEKRDKLLYDVEMMTKDVSLDQDKVTSTLLTLVILSSMCYRGPVFFPTGQYYPRAHPRYIPFRSAHNQSLSFTFCRYHVNVDMQVVC